jgi:hypothetical protein
MSKVTNQMNELNVNLSYQILNIIFNNLLIFFMKKAIILLSGGLDSATTCAIAKSQGFELYGLSFFYGQRHQVELQSAQKIADFFQFKEYKIANIDLRIFGGSALTANIEVPFKLSDQFTVYPVYRYYTQTASKYFAPFETHLSTEEYYTSDYDLSKFSSNQYGIGASYVDIFTKAHIWKFGLKNIDFRYNHYSRSDTLMADIASMAFKFIFQ